LDRSAQRPQDVPLGGALFGTALVALSKMLKHFQPVAFMSEGLREFVIDIVLESGVALIGAAVTAYLLGILLDQQREECRPVARGDAAQDRGTGRVGMSQSHSAR
jgi:hypothetical protein